MHLSGPFHDASRIDSRYTGEGADISPPLTWTDPPAETKSFVLICDDPDAPSPQRPAKEPWVHWVIYNIPPEVTALPEKISRKELPSEVPGARQGKNSWPQDNVGYRGPLPPPGSGRHRYVFRLYAVNRLLDLEPAAATKAAVLAALRGHVLAEANLMGTYERK